MISTQVVTWDARRVSTWVAGRISTQDSTQDAGRISAGVATQYPLLRRRHRPHCSGVIDLVAPALPPALQTGVYLKC